MKSLAGKQPGAKRRERGDVATPGPGGPPAEWAGLQPIFERIQVRFEEASREWYELVRVMRALREDAATALESVGDHDGDTEPHSPDSAPVGAEPPGDAQHVSSLERKLDELIALVRELVAEKRETLNTDTGRSRRSPGAAADESAAG